MAYLWKPVTEEEARQRSYYGFGGWMWLLYVLLLYLVGVRLSTVFVAPQFDLEVAYETTRQAKTMEYFAFVEILLWSPFLLLAPFGHRLMPRLAIYGFFAWWVAQLIVTVFVVDIATNKVLVANAISTIVTAICVSYLVRSRRVNLTYRLRERTN